jgi:hypothetical protein
MRKELLDLPNTVNYGEVRKSIRDLTRTYKPKDPVKFVKEFVKRYNIQKGFEKELLAEVQDELMKLNQDGK